MNQQSQTAGQADADCIVEATAGVVQVRDVALFGNLVSDVCSQFATRVFQWSPVCSLSIDCQTATATVHYVGQMSRETALRELAAALQAGGNQQQLAAAPQAGGNQQQCALQRMLRNHATDRVTIFRSGDDLSTWSLVRERDGAVVVQHEAARTWKVARRITSLLAEVPGIAGFRWRSLSRSLVVRFDAQVISKGDLLMLLDEAMLRARREEVMNAEYASGLAVSGIRRIAYLGLAAGTFGLAVLGVIVPGLPTVPFLLVTSYFLVRSSPRLNARLLQSRAFGALLRDWHEHRGMRPHVKLFTVATMLVVFSLTVSLGGLSLPLLLLVTVLILIGIYMVLRIPTISSDRESTSETSRLTGSESRHLITVTA